MHNSNYLNVALVICNLNIKGGTQKQFLRLAEFLDRHEIPFKIYAAAFDPKTCYPEFLRFADRIICVHRAQTKSKRKKTLRRFKAFAKFLSLSLLIIMKQLMNVYRVYKCISGEHNIINIHDHTVHWIAIFFKFRLWGSKPKVVWQLNDFPSVFYVGPHTVYKKGLSYYIERICTLPLLVIEKIVAHAMDAITVNVKKNEVMVKKIYKKTAYTFYPGIDKPFTQRKSFGDFHSPIRLVTTNVLLPYRRIEDIIYAMRILKQENLNCVLKVIGAYDWGESGYYEHLQRLISKYGMEREVQFLGQIDTQKMEEVYLNSDVFIFVNHNQSWGLAIFEAMSIGLPVIVSSTVGATEVLQADKNAVIVEPKNPKAIADAIVKLRDNPEYRRNIVKNAFELVDKYDWDSSYSSQMLQLFRSLTKEGEIM